MVLPSQARCQPRSAAHSWSARARFIRIDGLVKRHRRMRPLHVDNHARRPGHAFIIDGFSRHGAFVWLWTIYQTLHITHYTLLMPIHVTSDLTPGRPGARHPLIPHRPFAFAA